MFVYWLLFAAVVACIGAMFEYSYLSFPSLATGLVIISQCAFAARICCEPLIGTRCTASCPRGRDPGYVAATAVCRNADIGPKALMVRICSSSRTKSDPANPRAFTEIPATHSADLGTSSIHSRVMSRL